MIIINQHPLESTRTHTNSCRWLAATTIDGKLYTAESKKGAPQALARILVEAGIPDDSIQVHTTGIKGYITYKSFYKQAGYTFKEGVTTSLVRKKWAPFPDKKLKEPVE